MSDEMDTEAMSICEICSAELPMGDLFQCEECGIEGCSVCVSERGESNGPTLCEDCDTEKNPPRPVPRRKK